MNAPVYLPNQSIDNSSIRFAMTSESGELATGHLSWRDLLNEANERIAAALAGDRRQEARWLVERVSGYDASELRMNERELVSTRAMAFYDALVARRCSGEPLQYVLGRWSFRTLELIVDHNVLIPRPETEIVAGFAIEAAREVANTRKGAVNVVDLGTGSGAIALSVAVEVPRATVWATDVSSGALSIARANLAGIGRAATRVTVREGSWFDALPPELHGAVDVLVSNPPYVPDDAELADEVRVWEPSSALFAGPDGTADLAQLIPVSFAWLAPEGAIVFEMSPEQTPWALELASSTGFVGAHIGSDLAGKPRALIARKP